MLLKIHCTYTDLSTCHVVMTMLIKQAADAGRRVLQKWTIMFLRLDISLKVKGFSKEMLPYFTYFSCLLKYNTKQMTLFYLYLNLFKIDRFLSANTTGSLSMRDHCSKRSTFLREKTF